MTELVLRTAEGKSAVQGVLGFLNFSAGKPDARFQKQVDELYSLCAKHNLSEPWFLLAQCLRAGLASARADKQAAFRESSQVQAALDLTFDHFLPRYRAHHRDLFFHLSDTELWQPFFLARAFEAILSRRGPWNETSRIIDGALKQLNDYVGFRPVAVLENRQRGEPYDHERFRPIPLYVSGAGVAHGLYQEILNKTLQILRETDPTVLADAYLDPALLDEFALDQRGYDFSHPVDKRPNYSFGEWDPHHLDNQGRYRRYVARQITLDSILERVAEAATSERRQDFLLEAATVLAGTMLMATGVSGAGPSTHDSGVTLSTLVPRIARYRETFYKGRLQKVTGAHGERLRHEATLLRQPFGGARQHLNRTLARTRTLHLQRRHTALILAEIGYAGASRRQIAGVPVASSRLFGEMHILLTTGQTLVDRGELTVAAQILPQVEDLLRRGIDCGALIDPWNLLGFQGLFPRFTSMEDSVRDNRVEPLTRVIDQLFHLYGRVLSEGAAAGTFSPGDALAGEMRRLAEWWDRFATTTVNDVPHVHGGELTASAEHVADALRSWRERGAAAADLGFWREHLDRFHSPQSFALVVEALLRKGDFRAAMALLMTWVGQADDVGLQDNTHSFHQLALRWMLGVCALVESRRDSAGAQSSLSQTVALAIKFFDFLEANAEEYWHAPALDLLGTGAEDEDGEAEATEEKDSLYGAAYENVTYKDSTDDDVEGELLDFMPRAEFTLGDQVERLEKRLRFLSTLARLWNVATRVLRAAHGGDHGRDLESLRSWLARARDNFQRLLALLDAIHDYEIPKPTGHYDSLIEFDRRRTMKEHLLTLAIATCMDQSLAVGALRTLLSQGEAVAGGDSPLWESLVIEVEQALLNKDRDRARITLDRLLPAIENEPLLYVPLNHGGHPRQILRAGLAQTILRGLAANLPRQGLLRETYRLLRQAHDMEQRQTLSGPRVTEYVRLYQLGVEACAEAVIEAALVQHVEAPRLVAALETMLEPFVGVWMEHSRTMRIAMLEGITSDKEWEQLLAFIKKVGKELFVPRFMSIENLRGILLGGIGRYLDELLQNADASSPNSLLAIIENKAGRAEAERWLNFILQTLIENYDHFRDYSATTAQSDFGDNLHQLFDFLRLKASYERNTWQMRPLYLVHEALTRRHVEAASVWLEQVEILSRPTADDHLRELVRLEQTHGMRLATIRDRLEERFVKPMALDRLCALIEPAVEDARLHPDDDSRPRLEEELRAFVETPSGVGLDIPQWILRLKNELQRVKTSRTALVSLAETMFQVPRVAMSFDDLARQFKNWQENDG